MRHLGIWWLFIYIMLHVLSLIQCEHDSRNAFIDFTDNYQIVHMILPLCTTICRPRFPFLSSFENKHFREIVAVLLLPLKREMAQVISMVAWVVLGNHASSPWLAFPASTNTHWHTSASLCLCPLSVSTDTEYSDDIWVFLGGRGGTTDSTTLNKSKMTNN